MGLNVCHLSRVKPHLGFKGKGIQFMYQVSCQSCSTREPTELRLLELDEKIEAVSKHPVGLWCTMSMNKDGRNDRKTIEENGG